MQAAPVALRVENLKAGRFYRKRPEKETKKPILKDWLSLAISILAFSVSAFTAYYNVVRQVEDLSVLISSVPDIRMVNPNQMSFAGGLSLAFVNLGNRPIAVLNAGVWLRPKGADKSCTAGGAETLEFKTAFEPGVVKPGEILLKDATPRYKPNEKQILFDSIKKKVGKEELVEFQICAEIAFSPPSTAGVTRYVDLGDYGSAIAQTYMSSERLVDLKVPFSLIHKSNRLFGSLNASLFDESLDYSTVNAGK
jgi:hypothetical protein